MLRRGEREVNGEKGRQVNGEKGREKSQCREGNRREGMRKRVYMYGGERMRRRRKEERKVKGREK